jgi:glutamate transport system permease protein
MSRALYDPPGPRTRRIWSAVAAGVSLALVAGAYVLVYRPLAEHGQFALAKWGPIIDPHNQYFGLLWERFGLGVRNTLVAAAVAIVTSLLFGTALAVLRLQLQTYARRRYPSRPAVSAVVARGVARLLNGVTRFFIEIFRGLPVVITIFFVARGLPEAGLHLDDLTFLVIGLTVYNGVVIAEILRSGMTGLPRGQREAALAIGLSDRQTTLIILLPQALRIMLPALISQLVVVLKDTSLGGVVVGYEELLKVGSLAIEVLGNPIQIYASVAVMFLLINYALSRLARYLQGRWQGIGHRPGMISTMDSAR